MTQLPQIMKFKEIVNRLSSITMPIFGVSWKPKMPDVTVARRVIRYLEDRRVLYVPYDVEIA
jgi:hypothetical protein